MIDIRLKNGTRVQVEICRFDELPKKIEQSDKGDYWLAETWTFTGVMSRTVIHVLDPPKHIVEVLERDNPRKK